MKDYKSILNSIMKSIPDDKEEDLFQVCFYDDGTISCMVEGKDIIYKTYEDAEKNLTDYAIQHDKVPHIIKVEIVDNFKRYMENRS